MRRAESIFLFYIDKSAFMALLVCISLFLAQAAMARTEIIPIFTEGEVKGARGMTLGDPKKWGSPVSGLTGTSKGGKVTVQPQDYRSKGDAMRIKWASDDGMGELAIYGQAQDLSEYKNSHSLMFLIKVNSPPSLGVTVSLDCGFPCRAGFEIGGILHAIKPATWTAIPVPLSCFKGKEFDLTKVNGPFMISTPGALDVSIANVRIEKTPEGLVSCPEAPSQAAQSTAGSGLNPDFFYFVKGEVVGPRGILLGDPGKWGLNVEGLTGESASGKIKIKPEDFQFENDALRIKWSRENMKGELGIYGPATNIAAYVNNAALAFDVKVNSLPKESVKVGMDCGYPCRAEFEIGKTLRKLKKGKWTSFPVPLNCLKSSNFDLSKIGGVFLISTSGKLDLSVANVRLEKLSEGMAGCTE